ncbi:MAG: putative cytosol aminopeptidase [Phycisphaeraceae bacterium]|nr:MAG: putative cytosol aminopeptidase [Phycisphaeraceae bacterium]
MLESVRIGSRGTPSTLVLGLFKGQKLDAASAKLDPSGAAKGACSRAEASGDLGSCVQAFPGSPSKGGYDRVVVIGLGDADAFEPGMLRQVGAAFGRVAAGAKLTGAQIALDGALGSLKRSIDEEACGNAFGEGLGLVAWNYDHLRGTATTLPERPKVTVFTDDRDFKAGLKRGLGLAESANIARDLSQTPPNIAHTDYIAKEAMALARKFEHLKCTVIKGERLEKEKMLGLINVGKASDHAPCLIRLEWAPPNAKKTDKPIVLVGKTMTYDSGGLSIKVGGGMRGMKRDKDGGCAVFGAMHAVASTIKPKRRVVALLSVAENSISDEAYRPDDVIEFRNGVTVEVTNTDAEGRLVMADALCWACDKEKPACLIDMATLTGGVVVALGKVYAGMWCDDDALRGKLDAAADASGERVWRLPHHSEYKSMMKSPIADILNSAPVREAHPIQGAAFLAHFVKEGIPWAHIDIAGTHATDKDAGPFIAGPTGFGTRLLAELIDAF